MMLRFSKKNRNPETCLKGHRHYKDAYKIEGHVISGDKTYIFKGQEVSYSKAVLKLRIKNSIYNIDYTTVWESEEYRTSTDALNVLKAECERICEIIPKRIEVIEYLEESGKFEASRVYNPNNRQYILESTNI